MWKTTMYSNCETLTQTKKAESEDTVRMNDPDIICLTEILQNAYTYDDRHYKKENCHHYVA